MTFDGNPKPVQFIEPNVLDRACLSLGKHDGFAGQFRLHRTVLIQNFCRTAHHRWHCSSMFGPTVCAVQSGSTATLVPMLSYVEPRLYRSCIRANGRPADCSDEKGASVFLRATLPSVTRSPLKPLTL